MSLSYSNDVCPRADNSAPRLTLLHSYTPSDLPHDKPRRSIFSLAPKPARAKRSLDKLKGSIHRRRFGNRRGHNLTPLRAPRVGSDKSKSRSTCAKRQPCTATKAILTRLF